MTDTPAKDPAPAPAAPTTDAITFEQRPYTEEELFGNKAAKKAALIPKDIMAGLIRVLDAEKEGGDAVRFKLRADFAGAFNHPTSLLKNAAGRLMVAYRYAVTNATKHYAQRGVPHWFSPLTTSLFGTKGANGGPATAPYTVRSFGLGQSQDTKHPLEGPITVLVKGFASEATAQKFGDALLPGKVYVVRGGTKKGSPEGKLPIGTSVAVFCNGPGDVDLTPVNVENGHGDDWKNPGGTVQRWFERSDIRQLLAIEKPNQDTLYRIEGDVMQGSLFTPKVVDGKVAQAPPRGRVTLSDMSLDPALLEQFDGGISVFLPTQCVDMANLPAGAQVSLLVQGRESEYTVKGGERKGQKVKTVNWSAVAGDILFEGIGNGSAESDPEAPMVPPGTQAPDVDLEQRVL